MREAANGKKLFRRVQNNESELREYLYNFIVPFVSDIPRLCMWGGHEAYYAGCFWHTVMCQVRVIKIKLLCDRLYACVWCVRCVCIVSMEFFLFGSIRMHTLARWLCVCYMDFGNSSICCALSLALCLSAPEVDEMNANQWTKAFVKYLFGTKCLYVRLMELDIINWWKS